MKPLSNLGVRNINKKYDYVTFTQCCHCWLPKQCVIIPTSHNKLQEWDQPNQRTSLSNPSQLLTQPTGPWEQRQRLAALLLPCVRADFSLQHPAASSSQLSTGKTVLVCLQCPVLRETKEALLLFKVSHAVRLSRVLSRKAASAGYLCAPLRNAGRAQHRGSVGCVPARASCQVPGQSICIA